MDEFDKIRAFSKDILEREEPSFNNPDAFEEAHAPESLHDEAVQQSEEQPQPEGIGLTGLREEYRERFGFSPIEAGDFEEKKLMSMKWHVWAISIFAGLLIVVIAGVVFLGDDVENPDELIVIKASETPVKERPKHPGGKFIPDQEKEIYNRLRVDKVPTKVESLFPEPEQPVVPDNLITDKQLAAMEEEGYNVMEEPSPAVILPPTSYNAIGEVMPKTEKIVLKEQKDKVDSAKKETKTVPIPALKPVVQAEKMPLTEGASATPKPVKKDPVVEEKDVWRVQLMSSSNKETVEKAWSKILEKNKALLSNMSHEIKSVQIEGRGTFYRLRAGSFKTRDMAAGLCQKLKANKQDCVPSK